MVSNIFLELTQILLLVSIPSCTGSSFPGYLGSGLLEKDKIKKQIVKLKKLGQIIFHLPIFLTKIKPRWMQSSPVCSWVHSIIKQILVENFSPDTLLDSTFIAFFLKPAFKGVKFKC